jgi:hypothetical protein
MRDVFFQFISCCLFIDFQVDSFCDASNVNAHVKLSGYVNVTAGSEAALQYAVGTFGPVSVAIDAAHEEFEVSESW